MYAYISYCNYVNPDVDKYQYDTRIRFAVCFNALLASTLTFTYNKLNWTPTYHRYFNYVLYLVFFIENTAFIFMWKLSGNRHIDILNDNFIAIHFIIFIVSVVLKVRSMQPHS